MLTIEQTTTPRGIVLFSAGAGGDPRRYSALLEGFAEAGFVVIAPEHERLDGRHISAEQLRARVESLQNALAARGENSLPVIAAGHSFGGCAALCLAGAQPWGRDRKPIRVPRETRVSRLALFAPALDWFRAPNALDNVDVPIEVHSGSHDVVTPPESAQVLRSSSGSVEFHLHENVGHFDFMTSLPPGIEPSEGLDHDAFLRTLHRGVPGSV